MQAISRSIVSLILVAAAVVGCGDDPVEPLGSFTLTFQGDATFQGAHGGQEISAAVLDAAGAVVGEATGTVSDADDPSFSFDFTGLASGDGYNVHYWIDSNFGEGTAGACDGPSMDHQWDVTIGTIEADTTHTEEHRPTETAEVCSTFAATLTFAGDASFQSAHGGQDIRVAILNPDGVVVGEAAGTVSDTNDPSFSFDIPGLPLGAEYQAHYWIDSNFGGGTEGTCDEPSVDHQWSVALGVLEEDQAHTEDHRPTETADVCSTFSGT